MNADGASSALRDRCAWVPDKIVTLGAVILATAAGVFGWLAVPFLRRRRALADEG